MVDDQRRSFGSTGTPAATPFIDLELSRVNGDGSRHQYRVSEEPMFNRSCRFVGYRGIGVETGVTW